MTIKVLHVKVAEPMTASLHRAQVTMEALQQGKTPEPYYGVSFESLPQMLAVFTPKRLELVVFLRAQGPLSVAALARALKRNYKNVHGDVAALMEWLAIERNEDGRVFVPWDEIEVHLPLLGKAA